MALLWSKFRRLRRKVIMKNKIWLVLIITISVLLLAGCQSKQAKEVEDKISSIGEVTLDSDAVIKDAEMALEALNDSDAKSVKNVESLTQARNRYNELVKEKEIEELKDLAEDVDNAIIAIGNVSLNSKEAIFEARKKYNKLSDEAKKYVEKLKNLEEAERSLEVLHAEEAEKAIAAIGEVTFDTKSAIDAARDVYNTLTYNERKLVKNSSDLENAESAYHQLKIEDAEKLLASFKKSEDKVEHRTFYYPSALNWYDSDTWAADKRSFILPFLVKRGDEMYLYYTVNYTGSDWVFFNQITVAVGDERYKKTYDYNDVTRKVGWGRVWEYANKNGKNDMEMLRAIADSSEAIIRFEGDDYYKDLTVTDTDKKALRQAIEVYDAFNN